MVALKLFIFAMFAAGINKSGAIIGGESAETDYYEISRSIVLIDNNGASPRNVTPAYCSGAVISSYHVLTSATCCHKEIVGQRVQVGSLDPFDGGLSIPVQSHRILSASEVNDEDVELFLAICIIQLSAKVEVPALNLPYGESRPDFKEGGLIAFGFGSTVPNKHDVPSQMQAAEFIPTDDPEKRKCVFNRLYLRLRLTDVADDFDFFCMKERTEKLSLYDSGGPLVDKSSRIIYGTALAVFPNSTTYEQTLSHPAVFLPVSPHRFMIEWALEEMDKQVI